MGQGASQLWYQVAYGTAAAPLRIDIIGSCQNGASAPLLPVKTTVCSLEIGDLYKFIVVSHHFAFVSILLALVAGDSFIVADVCLFLEI